MNWLKVGFLLALTLMALRLLSWAPMWILGKITKFPRRGRSLVCNVFALALFVGILWQQRFPDEPFDWDATVFGMVVYLAFLIADMFWLPWKEGH